MKLSIYLISLLVFSSSFRIKKTKCTGAVSLQIIWKPLFNGKPLLLNKQAYRTTNGDTLFIDAFKFYVSHIKLKIGTNTFFEEKESYHLIDAENDVSQKIILKNIPQDTYTELHFFIGVDSTANVSGAMGGDLDPTKGMYWAWNTGYINAKIEGRANTCKTLHHAFEFHIGGYLPPYKTIREVVIPIQGLDLKTNQNNLLILNAEAGKWFTQTDLSKTNSIVMPCKDAVMMADKYKNMFSLSN
jgi:hypothetical protein